MTDSSNISSTPSAKDKLAGSRTALMHEMGFNLISQRAPIASSENFSTAVANADYSVDVAKRTSSWLSMGKSVAKSWWKKHPANAALTLATPTLQRYAQAHPGKVVAYGAAAGAVLYVARPWRLLSVTTIAALVLRRSTIAGLITGMSDRLPAARNPALLARDRLRDRPR